MVKELPRNLPDQIARSIGIQIIGGEIEQGVKIDNEDKLAADFGVSRTAVREAMKRLSAKGLVSIRPRVGTSVQSRNNWSLLDQDVMSWCLETKPSLNVLMQLREMRTIIEPGAVALACSSADQKNIDYIFDMYKQMEINVGNPKAYAIADAEFHVAILTASHNDYLASLAGLIKTDLLSSIKVTNPSEEINILSLPFHKKVATAISQHDVDKAEKAMKVLLKDAGKRLRTAFDDL